MSNHSTDQALGVYLQSLREGAGLDVAVLARRMSLSSAQLRQLEQGQDSLFYNRKIREQAARKVIAHLGGDLGRFQPETIHAVSPAPEAPTVLATPQAPPQAAVKTRTSLGRWWMGGVLLAALAWSASQLWPPRVSPAGMWVPTAASSTQEMPSIHAAPAQAASLAPLPVKAAVSPAPVQETQAAVAQASPALPAREKSGAGEPLQAQACPETAPEAPAIRPPQAYKAGDMVHVVSMGPVWVCLRDGSGKLARKQMEAGQAQSFYGSPPWTVRSEQLRLTQLYFQGWKVRLPEEAQDSIQLVELR
jgi:hypothetical protein